MEDNKKTLDNVFEENSMRNSRERRQSIVPERAARKTVEAPQEADRRDRRRKYATTSVDPYEDMHLHIPQSSLEENFAYRWVPEEETDKAFSEDWDFVEDKRLRTENREDGRVRRWLNKETVDQPDYAFLMKKYKDWDQEDRHNSYKSRRLREISQQMDDVNAGAVIKGPAGAEKDKTFFSEGSVRI